jgi:hypothetical protein
MALNETRQVEQTNIQLSSSGVMERGGIVSFMPWAEGLGYYAPSLSGATIRPVGILMEDIEDINPMLQPQYRNRNVSPLGSPIGVGVEGEYETDFVETTITGFGALTYAPGDVLYLGDNGQVSKQFITGRPTIGYALSSVDSDGFLKIRLQIQ